MPTPGPDGRGRACARSAPKCSASSRKSARPATSARRCRPKWTYAASADQELLASLGDDLRFVLIVSRATVHAGEGETRIEVTPSQHKKCERCWHWRLDQLTKIYFNTAFQYGERLHLLPFFDFTLVYNRGAAFSFLATEEGWQRWLFTGLAAAAVVIVWAASHASRASAWRWR